MSRDLLARIPILLLRAALILTTTTILSSGLNAAKPIRIGMIGLDTSHVISFTKIINDPSATGDLADMTIVAAYPGGSPSFPASRDRIEGFTEQVAAMGIEIVDSIPLLLKKVDVVMLESVDGSQHLEQAKLVFKSGKRVFIDKPFAASLVDAIAMAELSRRHNVPFFSCSGKRYQPEYATLLDTAKVGAVTGCDVYGISKSVPNHPDLFWYGIHGCEALYTILGAGCHSVTASQTAIAEQVTGTWSGGRVGTFRGIREDGGKTGFGLTVFGQKRIIQSSLGSEKLALMQEIARFFKTGISPVPPETTVEIFAFMQAAEASKKAGGKPIVIADLIKSTREQALRKLGPTP